MSPIVLYQEEAEKGGLSYLVALKKEKQTFAMWVTFYKAWLKYTA